VIVAVDPERVEESNRQRYVLAGDADVGVAKTALVKRAVEDDVGFGRKRHCGSALHLFLQPGPVGNGEPPPPLHSYVLLEGAELAFLSPSVLDLHDGHYGARGLRHESTVRPDTAKWWPCL
jgi:hypothetical protein